MRWCTMSSHYRPVLEACATDTNSHGTYHAQGCGTRYYNSRIIIDYLDKYYVRSYYACTEKLSGFSAGKYG